MALLEQSTRDAEDTPLIDSATPMVEMVAKALRRTHESETGRRLLSDAIERAHQNPDPGLLRVRQLLG